MIIQSENLGKKYIIGHQKGGHYQTLRDSLAHTARGIVQRFIHPLSPNRENVDLEEFWALKDIDFELEPGARLGVIGRNGAGKSTLLKVLSRITEPTTGRVHIKGRVSSLLEVGTGFHPELTGRENIFLNGAILGMTRLEIKSKFDEIVAFAEVEKFLDTPVKRYSSGMYVRLAFAVAAHLEPEILIVDEVLAVGDVAFQKKCMGRMGDLAEGGRTVIFVSHNMGAVSELCNQAILLDKGQIIKQGPADEVLANYTHFLNENYQQIELIDDPSLPCLITGLTLCNDRDQQARSFDIAEKVKIKIRYRITEPMDDLRIGVMLSRNMSEIFYSFDTDSMDQFPLRQPGNYQAVFTLPEMFLKAGDYSARITTGQPNHLLQDLEGAMRFEVEERSINTHGKGYLGNRPGHVISPGTWTVEKIPQD